MARPAANLHRPVLLVVVAIGLANIIAFDLVGSLLGGDAGNGKVVDARHFLNSHGAYTEVSRAVFTYSLWHARSLVVTTPLAGLAAMVWYGTMPADGGWTVNRLVRMIRDASAAMRRKPP